MPVEDLKNMIKGELSMGDVEGPSVTHLSQTNPADGLEYAMCAEGMLVEDAVVEDDGFAVIIHPVLAVPQPVSDLPVRTHGSRQPQHLPAVSQRPPSLPPDHPSPGHVCHPQLQQQQGQARGQQPPGGLSLNPSPIPTQPRVSYPMQLPQLQASSSQDEGLLRPQALLASHSAAAGPHPHPYAMQTPLQVSMPVPAISPSLPVPLSGRRASRDPPPSLQAASQDPHQKTQPPQHPCQMSQLLTQQPQATSSNPSQQAEPAPCTDTNKGCNATQECQQDEAGGKRVRLVEQVQHLLECCQGLDANIKNMVLDEEEEDREGLHSELADRTAEVHLLKEQLKLQEDKSQALLDRARVDATSAAAALKGVEARADREAAGLRQEAESLQQQLLFTEGRLKETEGDLADVEEMQKRDWWEYRNQLFFAQQATKDAEALGREARAATERQVDWLATELASKDAKIEEMGRQVDLARSDAEEKAAALVAANSQIHSLQREVGEAKSALAGQAVASKPTASKPAEAAQEEGSQQPVVSGAECGSPPEEPRRRTRCGTDAAARIHPMRLRRRGAPATSNPPGVADSSPPPGPSALKQFIDSRKPRRIDRGCVKVESMLSNKKTKKVQRKAASRVMCLAFLGGSCSRGDCRFSHDKEAYLARKSRSLPGDCPFAKQPKCIFGLTCAWAHPGDEAAAPASPPPSPSGERDRSSGQGPLQVAELPVLPLQQPTVNMLSTGLQHALTQRTYDFSAADRLQEKLTECDRLGKAKCRPRPAVVEGTAHRESASKRAKVGEGIGAARPIPAPSEPSDDAGGSGAVAGDDRAVAEGQATGADLSDGVAPGCAAEAEDPVWDDDEPLIYRKLWSTKEEWRQLHVDTPFKAKEKPVLDLRGKLYLGPLTTVGNMPFRRMCKKMGADITCGEMAVCTGLLQGQASEWALMRRHPCEDIFGVQIAGGHADSMLRCATLLEEHVEVDFVDVNICSSIDIDDARNAGSALLGNPSRIKQIVQGMSTVLSCPLTVKLRRGYFDDRDAAHYLLPHLGSWGAAAATLHGRSRQQRYSGQADWGYIGKCVEATHPLPLIGNGDIYSFIDYKQRMEASPRLATTMIARGALIKPWIFTEIKEKRDWDISAGQRLDLLKEFCSCGLLHWGSDAEGVEVTRKFLLEWLSYLCRYVPVGLLDVMPQKEHTQPPSFPGRSDLEILMGSQCISDWVKISEMLLGPAPTGFTFTLKH